MVDENMVVDNLATENAKDKTFSDPVISEEIPLNLEETKELAQNDNESSNVLENFDLNEESPQLFNDNNEIENQMKEKNLNLESDEEELEIPAFLRRQKN